MFKADSETRLNPKSNIVTEKRGIERYRKGEGGERERER